MKVPAAPQRSSVSALRLLVLEDRLTPSASAWLDLPAIPASPSGAASYIHPEHYRTVAIDAA